MVIEMDSIPNSRRTPGVFAEFNSRLAMQNLPANRQKLLIVGQRLATGSKPELEPLQIASDEQAAVFFGYGSHIHLMVRAALKANPYIALSAMAMDDAGAGVVSAGTVTIGGVATSSGAVTIYIGAEALTIAVASGDTAAQIATALQAASTQLPALPVNIAINVGIPEQLDITAKNLGTVGNDISIGKQISNASGVTITPVAMAGGLTDPDLAVALAVVFAEQYHLIITPYSNLAEITTLRTHVDGVSAALEQRPATGSYTTTGSLAAATTLAASVNHERLAAKYLRYVASQWCSLPMEITAAFASVVGFEEDPAKPLNRLPLIGIVAPVVEDRFSSLEIENLLHAGVSPLEVAPDGTVVIVRAITTYTKDANNIDDPAYLELNTIRTLDYLRHAVVQRLALRFPRSKKTERVKRSIKAEIFAVLLLLEAMEIVKNVAANKSGLLVVDNPQDVNRVDAQIPADIVGGLHIIATRIDLILT